MMVYFTKNKTEVWKTQDELYYGICRQGLADILFVFFTVVKP